MDVNFSYDKARNIVFVEYVDLSLQTRDEIDELLLVVRDFLAPIGRKVFILADMSGYDINPALTSYLAAKLEVFAQLYVILAFRYNVLSASTNQSIRASSMQSNLPINIFASRQEAMAALEKYKRDHD